MLVLLSLVVTAQTYYIYFSGKVAANSTINIVYGFMTAIIVYTIYFLGRKICKNEPVLIVNESEITINEKGKPVSFLWMQVLDWKIEKEEDGGTTYLTIETAEKRKKVNISWFDKKPAEIEELIRAYKK